MDRYGIKDTKYLPHIKPISILKKYIKITNINTKQVSNSLTNKFEEIKESLVVGQDWDNDIRIILFLVLKTQLLLLWQIIDSISYC